MAMTIRSFHFAVHLEPDLRADPRHPARRLARCRQRADPSVGAVGRAPLPLIATARPEPFV